MTVAVDPVLQAEADWLNGDTAVQSLLGTPGVLPYVRSDPPADARVCWLFRTQTAETRDANQLKRLTHRLQLRLKWPLSTAGANVVEMQSAADAVVVALQNRIRAVGTDKSHGFFFAVAESFNGIGEPGIQTTYTDAEQALKQGLPWQIDLTYTAIQDSISG